MSSIACAGTSCVAIKANHVPGASLGSAARLRKIIRLLAVVAGAGTLAACAQSSVVSKNSELFPAADRHRRHAIERHRW